MKKIILLVITIVNVSLVFCQFQVDSLVHIGVTFHDEGEYEKAIEMYLSALKINEKSPIVHSEMAMTYMQMKNYKKCIEHSDMAINNSDKFQISALLTKASCFDYLGKTKESIELFKTGLKEYGDHYLLYYNLAFNYFNIKEYDKAEENFINAIQVNPNHTTSHLLLGYLKAYQDQRVQSILCLNYFLYLEPNTDRARKAYKLLAEQMGANVQSDEEESNNINIYFNPDQTDSEFGPADLMLSILAVNKTLKENKNKTEIEMFTINSQSFFKTLGELKKKKSKGLWWDFYVPFFYDIARSKHIDTYCKFISISSSPEAVEWLRNNEKSFEAFKEWLKER